MLRIERMKDKPIEEARSRLQNMGGGSIEQMGQIIDMAKDLPGAGYCDGAIDAMGNGRRYGYGGQGGNTGGRRGYREPYIMGNDGDGEGRMGYRDQYGNFPADPKNRRRMRRGGHGEEPIGNTRQMVEDADPGRKRQPERDLEGLMPEMRHGAVRLERRRMGAGDDWPADNVCIPAEWAPRPRPRNRVDT